VFVVHFNTLLKETCFFFSFTRTKLGGKLKLMRNDLFLKLKRKKRKNFFSVEKQQKIYRKKKKRIGKTQIVLGNVPGFAAHEKTHVLRSRVFFFAPNHQSQTPWVMGH
jgi:hypothetical protein